MLGGIGCDLCAIGRMERAVAREHFCERVFTVRELAYCRSRGAQQYASLAARFAAKEALLKALGTGLRQGRLQEIEVVQDGLGQPGLRLAGTIGRLAAERGVRRIALSLTHEKEYAAAFVVLEVEKCD